MEQLKEEIIIDTHFQKSVNLNLDLGDSGQVNSYIPTQSSVLILKYYLKQILGETSENATILIGPYGKGKSHLLLVLLSLLQGSQKGNSKLISKIRKVDGETADIISQGMGRKKFLPVLVSGNIGSLNKSFLYALKEALERENMEDIVPASNYSEALRTLDKWQQDYPEVYGQWEGFLKKNGESPKHFQERLGRMDEASMLLFLECYPKLTAGSSFLPMVQSDAMKIYQEIGRQLTERYGYAGIVLVFDEFSKYLEGHGKENFSKDMKILQDMCELANCSREFKLHAILVAHKSIHEYGKVIGKTVKDAFRGVEGRLREVRFYVTARNHYELIADTLVKKEPGFSEKFARFKVRTGYGEILKKSYALPCFSSLFQEYGQYQEVMGQGCFPLLPVCAYILLYISEKVAQNERTIFTFLTSREQGSLPRILEKAEEPWVGADAVYGYFKNLFRENSDQPKIHNEWLKAEYALKHAKTLQEKKIIKAMALLRMLRQEDELPAVDVTIRLSLGMEEHIFQQAMEGLKQKEIVMFRSSHGIYAFKNNIGLNVEKELMAELAKLPANFPVCKFLYQASELQYILPKQHNQERNMTRYFQYEFLEAKEFFQMGTMQYLFEEKFSDGKILALVSGEEIDKEKVRQKLKELQDGRVVVLVPKEPFGSLQQLKKLAVISAMKKKPKFMEENQVLLRELELYEEDIIFEINVSLERDFVPGNSGCHVCYKGEEPRCFGDDGEFNRFLSGICEGYYKFSPAVNHELLNIQHVSGQYLRARNKVVAALLQGEAREYQNGTSPECMIYRAAFVRTGILDSQYKRDAGCSRVLEEIDGFFLSCIGQRNSFLRLYQKLQGKDYGVRKGVLPLFLALRLGLGEGVPVIYLNKKELEINEGVLNRVNDFPENYELYLEPESGKTEQYIRVLEQAWRAGGMPLAMQGRWVRLMEAMQKWFRSLPKYTMVTRQFPEKVRRQAELFRGMLKRSELNPREFLLERIPEFMAEGTEGIDLEKAAVSLIQIKSCMEQAFPHLQSCVAENICRIFCGKGQESLKGCLLSWYQKQEASAEGYVLGKAAHGFLSYLKSLGTNDELEIVSCLSRVVLDISLEDWEDSTLELFQERIGRIKSEVEETASNKDGKGKRAVILLDENGNHMKRCYETGSASAASIFLKNMIDDAMEDFEDTLETSQKVAVLAEVLQRLLQ